jgi:phytanoyl-CoA dioxygenase PhyH
MTTMAIAPVALPPGAVEAFRGVGYLVLRSAVDPVRLGTEVDGALAEGHRGGPELAHDDLRFRYVPMMGERTPVSLALLDALSGPAADLLGGPVLPLRAKGTRYSANAEPHRDSTSALGSVGFLCYLDALDADSGALRVAPGSHLDVSAEVDAIPLVALATEPGDVIVLDEHLVHGSHGGGERRQWRVDFFATPVDGHGLALARAYVAATFPPDWDGGYDAVAYPSFGPHWRALDRPWHAGLDAVGAYAAADAQEASYPRRQDLRG